MKDETHLRNFGTLTATGTALHGTFDKKTGTLISHSADNPPDRPCTEQELTTLITAYNKYYSTNEVRNNL